MARTPTYRSAGLLVVLVMDERVSLVLADGGGDIGLEAERLAHDLALRLPAD